MYLLSLQESISSANDISAYNFHPYDLENTSPQHANESRLLNKKVGPTSTQVKNHCPQSSDEETEVTYIQVFSCALTEWIR